MRSAVLDGRSRLNEVTSTTVPTDHHGSDFSPAILGGFNGQAGALPHSNSVPSTQIQWRMIASFRATATCAFLIPLRCQPQPPRFEGTPPLCSMQQYAGSLKQIGAEQSVAPSRHAPRHFHFAGLFTPWGETKISSDLRRALEARRIVDGMREGKGRNDAYTGDRHQSPCGLVVLCTLADSSIDLFQFGVDVFKAPPAPARFFLVMK